MSDSLQPLDCRMPSFPVHHQLPELKLMSTESVMPSKHLMLCCPLLLLPSIFPSIRVFSSGSALRIRWPKYWSFSFSLSPSNEHSGLISFRIEWLDLLAVQGTLKSLLQHHSLKASILWCSAFFLFLSRTFWEDINWPIYWHPCFIISFLSLSEIGSLKCIPWSELTLD